MTSSPSSSSTMGQAMERATPWKRGLYTRCLLLLASMVLWSLLFAFLFSNTSGPSFTATTLRSPRASRLVGKQQNSHGPARTSRIAPDSPCAGKYVYMHKLPPQFNQAMLQECHRLSLWTNMCKFTANSGLGPPLQEPGWFATNQFSLDIIFHNRMKQYRCLTNNSSQAVVLYVPFYAGLDISRHLWGANISTRDAASLALAAWLRRRPEWAAMGGRDHFLVGGRITWDFRRLTDRESDWGNKLLYLPEIANMSMLVVEASPFHTNDYAIPYPTYFHPSQDSDMKDWQERVSSYSNRSTLFSFAGAPRPDIATSIRGHIIEQCKQSRLCKLIECGKGESKCHSPSTVMRLFRDSVFCLQPQGDSFTRRSIFDSMICGCIPVFFHPDSAYSQYIWHLPRNHSAYSVFIPEDDVKKDNNSIEAILSSIPAEDILRLRLAVINLIPGLIYADPRQHLKTTKDAFDIAIQALVDKVTNLRVQVAQGREDKDAQTMNGNKKLLTSSRPREGSENATRHWEGQRWKGEQGYMETIEEVWSRDRAKKEAARGRKAFNREASLRSLKSLMRFRLDPPLDESSSDSNHNHPA